MTMNNMKYEIGAYIKVPSEVDDTCGAKIVGFEPTGMLGATAIKTRKANTYLLKSLNPNDCYEATESEIDSWQIN